MSTPSVLDQSHQAILQLMMLETPHRTEQLGYTHILATEDCILYVHVHNIKLYFLKVWNFWVCQAHETTNQVEVA